MIMERCLLNFPSYNLIKFNQFDTIYHEHYSYLSLNFLIRLAKYANLEVFEVEDPNSWWKFKSLVNS